MPTLIFLIKRFYLITRFKNIYLKTIHLTHLIYENVYALTARATGQIRLIFTGESMT